MVAKPVDELVQRGCRCSGHHDLNQKIRNPTEQRTSAQRDVALGSGPREKTAKRTLGRLNIPGALRYVIGRSLQSKRLWAI